MNLFSLIGLIILVIGVFLIGFGTRSTQTITNKVVQGVTGRYTSNTMWYLIGGLIFILVGGFFIFSGWNGVVAPKG